MTTAQLIVLWYAALLITALLLVGALDLLPGTMLAYLSGAIMILAAVLIYTLSPHRLARRRYVALGVMLPSLALGGAGLGWMVHQQRLSEREAARSEQEAERVTRLSREAFDRAIRVEIREAVSRKRREGDVVVRMPPHGTFNFPAAMSDEKIVSALEAHLLSPQKDDTKEK